MTDPIVGRIAFGPDLRPTASPGATPIRHPEAQHVVAMMDEHGRERAALMALWRAEWAQRRAAVNNDMLAAVAASIAIVKAVEALGPPPDEPEPTAAATPDLDRVRPSQEGGSGSAATPPTGTCNCLDAPEHGCPVHHLQAGEALR